MSKRTILCFGDSNSYGTPPMRSMADMGRHAFEDRWPGVMQGRLGDGWRVIDEALPGRTTVHDDPIEGEYRNGRRVLQACLESHRPLDVVAIMLGTNDLKMRFSLPPYDIAAGVEVLCQIVLAAQAGLNGGRPKLVVMAPVPVDEVGFLGEMFKGGAEKSRQLAPFYEAVAGRVGAAFLDTGKLVPVASPVDGVHYDPDAHHKIGAAMADLVAGL